MRFLGFDGIQRFLEVVVECGRSSKHKFVLILFFLLLYSLGIRQDIMSMLTWYNKLLFWRKKWIQGINRNRMFFLSHREHAILS